MNGFKVIALLILAVGLYHNYQSDRGQHGKAKVWQAICLALLVQAYSNIFGQLAWLLGNWNAQQQKYGGAVGYVSGELHWCLYLLHLGLALLTLLTALRMINRSDAARRRLLWLLPLLVLVETFSFYRGWLRGSVEAPAMHAFVLALGLAFNGGVALMMTLVYRSKFMRAFYQAASQPRATAASETTLAS
ncbi:hypothetical protein GCM10027594_28810 [Hymenobacter agri]